jgi:hypothetical protein
MSHEPPADADARTNWLPSPEARRSEAAESTRFCSCSPHVALLTSSRQFARGRNPSILRELASSCQGSPCAVNRSSVRFVARLYDSAGLPKRWTLGFAINTEAPIDSFLI